MPRHGDYVSDDSKFIRIARDNGGKQVRVLLLGGLYERLKPIYDSIKWISAGVGIGSVPSSLGPYLDWLSTLTAEVGVYGWTFTIAVVGWIVELVKNQVGLGKFTYGPPTLDPDFVDPDFAKIEYPILEYPTSE